MSSGNKFGSSNTDDNYGSSGRGNDPNDSTTGKFLEKVGGVFNSDRLAEKGQQKRAEAGNTDSYGSGRGDDNSDFYGSGRGNDNNDNY
jgi:hypothetical protein